MFKCLKKFFKKSQPERVVFNDDEIIRYLGDEVIERINWDEITEISVATTVARGCVYPLVQSKNRSGSGGS